KLQRARGSAIQGTPWRERRGPPRCADCGGEVVITQSGRCSRAARSANGSQETTETSGTSTDSARLGGLPTAAVPPAVRSRRCRQLRELASRSGVWMTASAPSIGPSPENCDVSTVTRWPSRARYFVIPATLRAATTKDGGEYCATNRIERPSGVATSGNLAAVRPLSRRAELVAARNQR